LLGFCTHINYTKDQKFPREGSHERRPHSPPTPHSSSAGPAPPRLLDQLRLTARDRGHAEPAVAAFADRSRRFIRFHGKRHPRELGLPEIGQFLESIAQNEKDPLPALATSRAALDFLYREVLRLDLGELPQPRPPRLLDPVRQVLRVRHYALRTDSTRRSSLPAAAFSGKDKGAMRRRFVSGGPGGMRRTLTAQTAL